MAVEAEKHTNMRSLAQQCAWSIMSSKFFRDILKEVVLRVLVEQEQIRKIGAVQAFLSECDARDIKVSLESDGKLYFINKDRLGADLRAVLTLHRQDIIEHLKYHRELEAQAEARMQQRKAQ